MNTEGARDSHDALQARGAYIFGRFRLDPGRGLLFRDGDEVSLRPKAFDVLHCLVRNAGRIVSRSELFEEVWPNLVVSDDSLTQCLIEIRKALGDDSRDIVRTVPRRGYILQIETEREGPRSNGSGVQAQPGAGARSRLPSRWTVMGLGVLALAIAWLWWRFDAAAPATEQATARQASPASIAVLPFVDMSETQDQQYLAEGIAEEILNLLAQSPDLTVMARTSSFSFQDSTADIGTIARVLNVANVLEGSVRKAGDRIRVTAQLVDGDTGAHIWSETFDDQVQDVFGMQDRIAQNVATVLEARLGEGDVENGAWRRTAHLPELRAWEPYIRGRHFYGRRAEGDVMRAQRSFEQALEIDPGMAEAWVSLAATINLRRTGSHVSDAETLESAEALPAMRNALERALELDPQNPEALWRFSLFLWWEGREEEALDLIEQAVERGQNHALVQAMMGGFAYDTGHLELALPFIRRAARLDPLGASPMVNFGDYLLAAGRLEEAESAIKQAAELNHQFADRAHADLAWIRICQGDLRGAAEFASLLPPGIARDQAEAMLGHLQGDQEVADKALSRLLARSSDDVAPRLAFVYAVRGENDEAFRWLAIAGDNIIHSQLGRALRGKLVDLQHAPLLKPLHVDPRWDVWLKETSQQLLIGLDHEVVPILQSHLERHPQLYSPAGQGWARPESESDLERAPPE